MKPLLCNLFRGRAGGPRFGFVVFLAWMAGLASAQAQLYLITDLGTNVYPQAINNKGDVVGYLSLTNGWRAFFYTNGVGTSVGGGMFNNLSSVASAINNNGQSVGWHQTNALPNVYRAFLSTNSGTLGDLGTTELYPGGPHWNGAVGINDAGQILGTRSNTFPRAYLIANGQTNDLPLNGSDTVSFAGALSQNGSVAYMAGPNVNFFRAYVYTNGVRFALPTPANMSSYATGINDSNQVVGYLQTTNVPYVQQAFFFDGTTLTNIGTVNTNPPYYPLQAYPGPVFGLNNYGQVVGTTIFTNTGGNIGFLYDVTNGVTSPQGPSGSGWVIGPPTAINDPGQIVGAGLTLSNLQEHGYLLTPALFFNPSSFKCNNGTVSVSVSGLNGQTVVIQASDDLMAWVSISTNVMMHNKTTFQDVCTTGRFYRAVVVQ